MPGAMPFGEQVTRLRAGTVYDELAGEDVEDWTNPDSLGIDGVGVSYGIGSIQFQADRTPITTYPVLYCDYDADIRDRDKLIVRGVTYWVDGHPFTWRNPLTGLEAGKEVHLRAVEG